MYGVELYAAVRLAVVDEGLSHHEACRRFGIDRRTVKKMLSYSAPPGYRRTKPVRRPKLDGFTGIVDAILEADTDPDVPRKQRHTAHRIFERLRDEHGFSGGYTIVKDYVRSRRQSTREAFVPLHHPPGHAQVDFGEAVVEHGLPVMSHGAHDLHIHLLAAAPNAAYLEWHAFGLDRFMEDPLTVEDGYARAPDRPGHGIVLDWQALAAHRPG